MAPAPPLRGTWARDRESVARRPAPPGTSTGGALPGVAAEVPPERNAAGVGNHGTGGSGVGSSDFVGAAAGLPLLARQPRAPRGQPARAVAEGATEDRGGVDDGAIGREADGPSGAGEGHVGEGPRERCEQAGASWHVDGRRVLGVGDVDPAAIIGGDAGPAVGEEVPQVGGAWHRDQRGGHHPRREALGRSEEHKSELQSLMRLSYAVYGWSKKKK